MKRMMLLAVLLLPLAALAGPKYSLLVDKGAFTISVLDDAGQAIKTFPVATGENAGRKRKAGDAKTPEGTFTVTWVQNTRGVLYDYHDGHGLVEAYGPWFIHLETGFKAIGIHGTCPHRDNRIGTRDSKGCIRLHNADLLEILPYVEKGTKVIIIPGPEDKLVDRDL